jgi:peroxin-1
MPSKRKLAPVVGREGISSGSTRELDVSTVEVDTTFGRVLGLSEGQKVSLSWRLWLPRLSHALPGWDIHSR